jgi:hypothetical protein
LARPQRERHWRTIERHPAAGLILQNGVYATGAQTNCGLLTSRRDIALSVTPA